MKNARQLVPISLIFILLSACVKEKIEITDIDSNVSPEFGVPLTRATIFTSDVIERFDDDGFIVEGEDEVLQLVYRDSLESISADEFLSLSNQSLSESAEVPPELQIILNTVGGTINYETSDVYELDFGEDRLDSIRFSDGLLQIGYTVPNGFTVSGLVEIIDPTNQEILLEIPIQNEGTNQVLTSINLENELIRFVTDESQGITNGIQFNFFIEITAVAGSEAPDEVIIDFALSDFSIATVGGFIAPRTFNIDPQATDINIYESDFEGEIVLEDPRLSLFIANGFGIAVRPLINDVGFYDEEVEVGSITENSITPLPIILGASSSGDVANTEIVIDNDLFTSGDDLTELLRLRPDSVSAAFDLDINPESNPQNFISDASELAIEFEVELPIYGSVLNFNLIDTTDINFGDIVETTDDFQELEQIDLRLFVRNGLPIDAGVQMIFTDDALNPIDSLFAEPTIVIASAPVNLSAPIDSPDYGRVIGESNTQIDIEIPRERVNDLENATRLIIEVFGNTTGNSADNPIRLYPENFIEVNLAAKGIFNLELE